MAQIRRVKEGMERRERERGNGEEGGREGERGKEGWETEEGDLLE